MACSDNCSCVELAEELARLRTVMHDRQDELQQLRTVIAAAGAALLSISAASTTENDSVRLVVAN